MRSIAAIFAVVAALAVLAPAQNLIGCDPYGDSLFVFDTAGNLVHTATVTHSGGTGTVSGLNGMARDPITGRIYVVGDFDGLGHTGRGVGTLGPIGSGCNTDITVIGDTGDQIAGLTFVPGALAGAVGDGGTANNLGFINTTTGAFTPFFPLGNGNDGEAVAFNPNDGLVYHASGRNGGEIFETITGGGVVTNVGYVGPQFNTDEIIGMVFDPASGGFFAVDLDLNLMTISTGGLKTFVAALPVFVRGLVFADVQFPGTPDDLATFYSVNGAPVVPAVGGTDTVCLNMGDTMTVNHDSVMGTQYFAGDVIVYGSLVGDLSAMGVPFPGIHVGGTVFAVVSGSVAGIPLFLGPGGVSYSFVYGGGPLAGNLMVLQAAVLSGAAAANMIFSSTNGLVIGLN